MTTSRENPNDDNEDAVAPSVEVGGNVGNDQNRPNHNGNQEEEELVDSEESDDEDEEEEEEEDNDEANDDNNNNNNNNHHQVNNNNHAGNNDNRHVGGTSAIGMANQMGNNILQACSCLATAVREYYRMPKTDQLEVWDDLTGYQGQKRIFVHGKELPGYREEYEPRNMVDEALKQLPIELQRMPSSHPHEALDQALKITPEYVNDPTFQLKFLRAEKFEVYSAAIRMCRHFEAKLELFGPESLGREIVLEDLDEDDMAAFETGYLQILQSTDQGRRPVIFYYKAISDCYKKRENILRVFWYMANRLSEHEEVQKLGVSNVVYNIGGFPRKGLDYEKSRRFAKLIRSVPIRYNNFFVCLDDNPWLTVVETFAVMITRFLRVRLRMMRGTHEEVMQKLKAVGIPTESMPVNEKSDLLLEAHLEWIQKQREREQKLKEQEEVADLVPETTTDFLSVKDSYGMDALSSLSNLTASFYGPPAAADAAAFPAESFHAIG